MLPSSFITSTITAAGLKPARRARSQPASVWPARVSTPPSRARKGKIWPGCTRSSAPASGATAVSTVWARSAAEMPVVTPVAASMETVKAVAKALPLAGTICSRPRRWQCSSVRVRQIRPRASRAMKLIASGVHISAASSRSPSFSRSSSSTSRTILPRRKSSMISSMRLNGMVRYLAG
ncbi:hypothetical protein D3C84_438890 [compost metagenome]